MPAQLPYNYFPLGDAALLLSYGNRLEVTINAAVLQHFYQLQKAALPFVTGLVPAYASLTIHYQPGLVPTPRTQEQTVFDAVVAAVEKVIAATESEAEKESRTIRIPVCYEAPMAPDMEALATEKNLRAEEVIALHTGRAYRVFTLGFLPGFAYMGSVCAQLATPRKAQPQPVAAGAVGIAGTQTGIYPLQSPGGWHIIGRTPLRLFDAQSENPVLLQPGDTVQFFSITLHEFAHY